MKASPDHVDQYLTHYCRRLAGDPPATFSFSLRVAAADTGLTTKVVRPSLARLIEAGTLLLDVRGHGGSASQYRLAAGDQPGQPLPLADRLYAMAVAAADAEGAFELARSAAAAGLGSTPGLVDAAFADLVEAGRIIWAVAGTPNTPTRYAIAGTPAAAEAADPNRGLVKCSVCSRLYRGRVGDGCPGFLGHPIFRTLRRRVP